VEKAASVGSMIGALIMAFCAMAASRWVPNYIQEIIIGVIIVPPWRSIVRA